MKTSIKVVSIIIIIIALEYWINDPDFIIELDIEGLIFRPKRINDPDFIIYCLFYYSYEISMDH
jgi:hypothetical protein